MIDVTLAEEAVASVGGERMGYSSADPYANLHRIAALWSAYLGCPMTGADVSKMMVLVKLSRSRAGSMRDHYVDGIGYLLLAEALDE